MIPVDSKLLENIYLANNFDCWMGHCNFNISDEVGEILDEMPGVEIMKVCSRYRFFLGVGRMFKFKDVRQEIEKTLSVAITKDQKDESDSDSPDQREGGEVPEGS